MPADATTLVGVPGGAGVGGTGGVGIAPIVMVIADVDVVPLPFVADTVNV